MCSLNAKNCQRLEKMSDLALNRQIKNYTTTQIILLAILAGVIAIGTWKGVALEMLPSMMAVFWTLFQLDQEKRKTRKELASREQFV